MNTSAQLSTPRSTLAADHLRRNILDTDHWEILLLKSILHGNGLSAPTFWFLFFNQLLIHTCKQVLLSQGCSIYTGWVPERYLIMTSLTLWFNQSRAFACWKPGNHSADASACHKAQVTEEKSKARETYRQHHSLHWQLSI